MDPTSEPRSWVARHQALALVLVLLLGLAVRVHHLATVPVPNETVDEYAWTWAGMTLLDEHTPRSWSYLGGYGPVPRTVWRGHEYFIVRPWLDHPPLFPILIGAWMHLGGYHDIFAVDLGWMRWLSIWLFAANVLALFALARRYFAIEVVLLGLCCFALAPLAVVNQKLVVSENLFVLIWMATQIALFRSIETGRRRWLIAVGLGAVALPLTKIAALSCSLHLALLTALRRQRRAFALVVAGTALGLGGYLAWGFGYSASLFPRILASHAIRFVGLGGGWHLLFALKMVDHPFVYAPFIFALFAMVLDASDKHARELYLQYVVYVLCMIFFVDERSVYGWYTIPLYPVACMALARGEMMLAGGARSGFVALLWVVVVVPFLPTLLHHALPLAVTRYGYLCLAFAACATVAAAELGRPRAARMLGITLVVAQLLAELYYDVTL